MGARILTRCVLFWAFAFATSLFLYFSSTRSTSYKRLRLVNFHGGSNPSIQGQWGPKIPVPLIPVAAAVLPQSGRILMFAADKADQMYAEDSSSYDITFSAIYDPFTGSVAPGTVTNHGMFCPGLSLDFQGRPVVTGGMTDNKVSIFDDESDSWISAQNMTMGRGYHAQTTLSDGRIFTIGGSWNGGIGGVDVASKGGEVFDPIGNAWTALPDCPVGPMLTNDSRGEFFADNHAWLFAWKNESVFQAGPSTNMNWYGTRGLGDHRAAGVRGADEDSMNGNAIMYDATKGKILTLGGAPSYALSFSTRAAHIITLSDPFEEVEAEAIDSMHDPRAYANSVVLPTGDVFVNGGVSYARQWTDVNSSLTPELWNPVTRRFTKMVRSPTPRNYHSIAILLPDATVLTGGGGLCWRICEDTSANHLDLQVFYPPYLFNSDRGLAQRPVITGTSPSIIELGASLFIFTNEPVAKFALIRYGSVTHSINTDQRRIQLDAVALDRGEGNPTKEWKSQIEVPRNPGIVPPGWWMLFAINDQGVPSHAATIDIRLPNKLCTPAVSNIATPVLDQDSKQTTSVQLGALVSIIQPSHPRLFATEQEWDRLPEVIGTDSYMTQWHQTISERAEIWRTRPHVNYSLEGISGNGVLDTAREVQLRVKHWAYMFRVTRDTKWKSRVWEELLVASGNSTVYFGVDGDNWNSQ
jgi:galactose oxidase